MNNYISEAIFVEFFFWAESECRKLIVYLKQCLRKDEITLLWIIWCMLFYFRSCGLAHKSFVYSERISTQRVHVVSCSVPLSLELQTKLADVHCVQFKSIKNVIIKMLPNITTGDPTIVKTLKGVNLCRRISIICAAILYVIVFGCTCKS